MAIKIRLLVRVGCDFVVHTQVKVVHLLLRKSEKYVSVVWVSTQSDDLYSPGSEWDCDTILRNTSASNASKQPIWGYAVHPLRGWSFRTVSPTCASACRCYIDFRPWLKLFCQIWIHKKQHSFQVFSSARMTRRYDRDYIHNVALGELK